MFHCSILSVWRGSFGLAAICTGVDLFCSRKRRPTERVPLAFRGQLIGTGTPFQFEAQANQRFKWVQQDFGGAVTENLASGAVGRVSDAGGKRVGVLLNLARYERLRGAVALAKAPPRRFARSRGPRNSARFWSAPALPAPYTPRLSFRLGPKRSQPHVTVINRSGDKTGALHLLRSAKNGPDHRALHHNLKVLTRL
jgi:hypothetical protein